ncbi:3-prime end of extracellular mutant protein [Metschnikowia bicuspidata var. bicuspidata NRRL YB-4993]|uniref:3-prime end of extracellular mutant protein n=1 Tax=Metschnikowia bicuspidata var. bicuspidata NRRL YB-4993 TaxID=869754 RepID=A0A1A0HCA0_9ASCO|nr:3-prime end of extracellular mutant protein [Metschnikowia bicuspidata var. bicuspidata NRRL YB-4993]OBA21620.1 3-prime end of extracellular mutant protein [Metschnikowia bicuspidata var. bicuspidata NRRL YB-4993]
MQYKSLVAAAAVLGLAAANSITDSTLTTATPSVTLSCSFKDFTATALSQVASVAACATAVGDIYISGDAFGAIDLTGVERIYGDLNINGTQQATSFNAPTLELVSGELLISYATILASVNLAQLTTVGTLTYNALPALESTGLTTGVTSAENILFTNTGLTSLSGIDVYELTTFEVSNNADIATIDSGLESVTTLLTINYNSDKVEVYLDLLTSAKSVIFQSIASLSVANLTTVNGSLALQSNSFDSFEFPVLTSIGNSLSIEDNDNLEEFDFPVLKTIGGALSIEDNDELSSFSYFPNLTTIGGSVTIDGDFDNGTFPSLTKVSGGFNLTTTGDLSCDAFTELNSDGDIEGDEFYCEGASSTVSSSSAKTTTTKSTSTGTSGSSSTSTSSSTSSTKSSGAAPAAGLKLVSVASFFLGVGALLF